ncbi:MAG: Do family serine endopeptidase [Woeseiaceae bacterium]|jgi:Do/DeqQ family serine protease|nr:Do family serine endopeptidase [Woeseiaceae bacterium]MDG1016732.1 Do family serine endopeptidase [Woeseiaceae bacterium]MDG1865216.1 Do family serine endopeptidase [Woeseiaceae bacterium]
MRINQKFIQIIVLCLITTIGFAALPRNDDGAIITSLAPLVKQVAPAVVNIRVSQTVQSRSPYDDEMFRRFFGTPNSPNNQREVQSAGSGVIVDAENGYILTNHHVVSGAEKIQISLINETTLDAEVIGSDPATDIALLKVEADDLTDIIIGESDAVEVGDFVIAIGNPFGLGNTVTSGIVSALGRTGISESGYEDFIQTDASINPGNSGGALVNMKGELVGINSAIISRSGGNVGIGFAVPSEIAQSIMSQILDFGEVRRGLLGVSIQTIDKESAEILGVNTESGALISAIEPGSAAEKAALKVDDIIIKVDDEKITTSRELANAIGLKGSGDTVIIEYMRGSDILKTEATLGQQVASKQSGSDIHPGLNGASLASSMDKPGIIVTEIEAGSPAAQRGLRKGDIIIAVNRLKVETIQQLEKIAKQNSILYLMFERDNRTLILRIQ